MFKKNMSKKDMSVKTKCFILFIGIAICVFIIWVTIDKIQDNNLQSDPKLQEIKEKMMPIDPTNIKKLKIYRGDKSYTINKKKIYLCLYDKNGGYYPINTLIHVFLHEYAHVLNKKNIGHTPEFYAILDKLEKHAEKLGLYDSSKPAPPNYCTH